MEKRQGFVRVFAQILRDYKWKIRCEICLCIIRINQRILHCCRNLISNRDKFRQVTRSIRREANLIAQTFISVKIEMKKKAQKSYRRSSKVQKKFHHQIFDLVGKYWLSYFRWRGKSFQSEFPTEAYKMHRLNPTAALWQNWQSKFSQSVIAFSVLHRKLYHSFTVWGMRVWGWGR